MNNNLIAGAKFKANRFVTRPTTTSIALHAAGLLPGLHVVQSPKVSYDISQETARRCFN